MRVWLPIVVGLAFGTVFVHACTHATVQAKPVDSRGNEAEIMGVVPAKYHSILGQPAEPLINVYRVIDRAHHNICYIAISARGDEKPSIACLPQAYVTRDAAMVTE